MSKSLRISLALLCALPLCATDTITAGHPRVWLTPAMITNIHAHVLANDATWTAFTASTDYLYSDVAAGDVYLLTMKATMYVALHNIPGDSTDGAAYDPAGHTSANWAAQAVSQFVNYANGQLFRCPGSTLAGCLSASPMVSPMQGNDPKNQGQEVALTYDWLQYGTDQWGSNKTMANQFLQAVSGGLQAGPNGDPVECGAGAGLIIPDDNECAGNVMTQVMAALAIFGDGLNPLDNQDRLGNPATGTNQQFDWVMNDPTYGYRPLFLPYYNTGLGVGSVQAEGASYGYGDFAMTARGVLAVQNGSNANIIGALPDWLNETALWAIHSTVPVADSLNSAFTSGGASSYWLQFGDLNAPSDPYAGPRDELRAGALIYSYLLGSSTTGQYLRDWLNNKFPAFPGGTSAYDGWYQMLFQNFPSSTTASFAGPNNYWSDTRCTLPTSTCGMNFVSSRSNWTSSNSWVTMRMGNSQIRHGHEDTGTFTFYRKGTWLVLPPPGYQAAWNSGEMSSNLDYQGTNDHNGSGVFVWKGPGPLNAAGGPVDEAYENPSGDQYTYTEGELTGAYTNSSTWGSVYGDFENVQHIRRAIVHIKPDYVVVMDRAVFRDSTTARFQVPVMTDTSTPSSSSGVVTSVNGAQKLFFTPLLPASPTINVTNLNTSGQDFSILYDALEPYGAYATLGCYANVPACINSYPGISFYRADSVTTAATSQVMLNVLQGADSGATAAPAVAITSGNYSGAHVKDAGANWVVGFSNIAAGTGLSLPVSYSYTPTTTTRKHLIANLPASAAVCVTDASNTITVQTCGSGTAMTVSSQGTLAFSDISGTLAQMNIAGTLSISNTALPGGTVGISYSASETESGGVAAYTYSATGLPSGLTISSSTGLITGTPTTTVGSPFAVQITVVDSTTPTPQTASTSGLTITIGAGGITGTSSLGGLGSLR